MKGLKKFLFFFLILFAFGFSSENRESKVVLDKVRETSQLKIGVTKIKSKELPMEFDVESKKVYGEIEITDNDLVFVSETLDEIPSVSTTNGRRVINNINKYLTKNIKESPKFNYQIVDGKTESGEKNGKKYLLIDCKEQLSSVYVYVLEKGTYKIKNVYKGAFKQLFNERSTTEYGTINITKNFLSKKDYKKIYYDGSIKVKNNTGEIDKDSIGNIELKGNYPEKIQDGTKYDETARTPSYKIEVYRNSVPVGKTEVKYLEGAKYNIIRETIDIKSIISDVGLKLILETKEDSKYYNIYLSQPYPYEKEDLEIRVIYGAYGALSGFHERDITKFKLVIEPKQMGELPEGTEGTVILKNVYNPQGATGKNTTLLFDEKRMTDESLFKYKTVIGEVPEILDLSIEENRKHFPIGNENFLKISYKNNADDTTPNRASWEREIRFDDKNINFNHTNFKTAGANIYTLTGLKLGEIAVEGETKPGEKNYFKIVFYGSQPEWQTNIHREVASTLTFQYVTRSGDTETVLKKDKLHLVIQPKDEKIAPETRGTLLITNSKGLPGKDLFITSSGTLGVDKNDDGYPFTKGSVSLTGELPKNFATNIEKNGNDYWINIEKKENFRLRIEAKTSKGNQVLETDFDYKTGAFSPDKNKSGWLELYSNSGKHIGWIGLSSIYGINDKAGKQSITIGFREKHVNDVIPQPEDFEWRDGDKGVFAEYEFHYQKREGLVDKWETIKKDVLELVIQPGLDATSPEIELKNPLVYYDYNSSSAISNIVHNRRAHLSSEPPKTLNNSGAEFRKNTSLDGDEWIKTTNTVDYKYQNKHKVSIVRGTDEVLKNTTDNGGTKSSTYLNKDGNEVMFSYDGGNKYLNFGLSKYNFDGGEIKDIAITHFNENGGFLEERRNYTVIIPKFEGIHYVGNYDIKPRQSYTKNYEYQQDILYNEPVIIDYGTVGFRNLDTRITNQSGGKGIDFKVTTKVKLVSEKNSNYIIRDARLYFEEDEGKVVGVQNPIEVSIFKGENEKATSKMLKLYIPRQETLIPQGKFKILTDDELNKDVDNNPLKVGVTVSNKIDNTETNKDYYTYIGANQRGEKGKDLYLNLTVNRFVETRIEFENPELKSDKIEGENWIKLNESDYPNGELTRDINSSNLWGRVRGKVIDIPKGYTDVNGKFKEYKLKMTLFNKNGDVLVDDLNKANGRIELSSSTPDNKRHFIIGRENPDDNFIRFTLDNGYDDTLNIEKNIEFYIRYIDTTTKDESIKKEGDFLFDQRYIVSFKKKAVYKGDITLRFKNPSMTTPSEIGIGIIDDRGKINLYTKSYFKNGNHDTAQDKIEWIDKGISDKIISEIKNDVKNSTYTFTEIGKDNTPLDYSNFILQLDENNFIVGLSGIKKEFEKIFGTYNEEKIDKSFELKFNNDNKKAYRINVVIDEFDPRYYGKVFSEKDDTKNYEKINIVGVKGEIDLTNDNNLQADGFVYIDLDTSYRDYLRYEALPTSILNKGLSVKVEGDVDVVPTGSDDKKIKGNIVLVDGKSYIDITNTGKKIEFTNDGKNIPKSYPMKLKLSKLEYQKLRPYTKYEIFLNGNQNILTIGTNTKKENILFDKPLSFNTIGPSLKIKTNPLDFGQIKPKKEKEQLITKSAKTEIFVEINNTLDTNLELKNAELVPETDTIYINQVSASGKLKVNSEGLKVRDLKTTKTKTISPRGSGTTIETYELGGTLEVRKDIPEENYGEYRGHVMVEYTFY